MVGLRPLLMLLLLLDLLLIREEITMTGHIIIGIGLMLLYPKIIIIIIALVPDIREMLGETPLLGYRLQLSQQPILAQDIILTIN